MTRQRALILDIMREKSPQHLTADELFNEARLRMPHIARGTVYRNLKMMELDPAAPTGTITTPVPTATCCATAAATWRTCR